MGPSLSDVFPVGRQTAERDSEGRLVFWVRKIKGLGPLMCPLGTSEAMGSGPSPGGRGSGVPAGPQPLLPVGSPPPGTETCCSRPSGDKGGRAQDASRWQPPTLRPPPGSHQTTGSRGARSLAGVHVCCHQRAREREAERLLVSRVVGTYPVARQHQPSCVWPSLSPVFQPSGSEPGQNQVIPLRFWDQPCSSEGSDPLSGASFVELL